MLSFLNYPLLSLAGLAVVPLLIYLFARKRPAKIIFSSLRFLKITQQQQQKRINLKNLLLLLLRMAAILFLFLGLARPALKMAGFGSGTTHPPTAVGIIIDNSYSMDWLADTRTDLDIAKQTATKIIKMLTTDDWVVPASLNKEFNQVYLHPHKPADITALLPMVKVSAKALELNQVMQQAAAQLAQTGLLNREIYIIGDNQTGKKIEPIDGVTVFYLPVGQLAQKPNAWVQDLNVYTALSGEQDKLRLDYTVAMPGVKELPLRLFAGGSLIAEQLLTAQNGSASGSFTLNSKPGWQQGYLETGDERLSWDNRRWFCWYNQQNLKIGVFTDLPVLPLPLATLLNIYAGSGGQVELLPMDIPPANAESDYANIVVYGKKNITPALATLLKNKGGLLFVSDADGDGATKYWETTFNLKLKQKVSTEQTIDYVMSQQRLGRLLKNRQRGSVGSRWQVDLLGTAQPLIAAAEDPLLLRKDNLYLWLADLNDKANPLLYSPVFPVAVAACMEESGKAAFTGQDIKVEQPVLAPGKLALAPNQQQPQAVNGRFVPSTTGVWRFYNPDTIWAAVNLDYSESNWQPRPDSLLGAARLASNWQDEILTRRQGSELWRIMLLLSLLCLAAEMIIARRGQAGSN